MERVVHKFGVLAGKLLMVGMLCATPAIAGRQAPTPSSAVGLAVMQSTSPDDLVAKVIQNELQVHDEGHFMYRDRKQTPEGSKTKEMIETQSAVVARLLAINDQPLTPAQRGDDDARLQNLLTHPELQAQKQKEQQKDEDQVKKLFRELPRAFDYLYDGMEEGPDGPVIKLKFTPKPNYNPPSRDCSVYKGMAGHMSVTVPEYRLVRIEATLFHEVTFGWGVLGHLDAGGHFIVEQSKIGPHRWEVTSMNIQFTGKILFFKSINLHEIEILSDFQLVPDDLTLEQGVERLKKQVISSKQ
jgi:hypothetical protein